MKRLVSLILLPFILMVSACALLPPLENLSKEESSPESRAREETSGFLSDLVMQGISFCTSMDELLENLGEPVEQYGIYSEYLGEDLDMRIYGFGEVGANSENICSISVTSEGYEGVRGIQVGDEVGDVLRKFTREIDTYKTYRDEEYFYGGIGSPISGILKRDERNNTTEIMCFYGNREEYPEERMFPLVVEFEEGRVISVNILARAGIWDDISRYRHGGAV